jgi:hypothetical protein
VPIGLSQGWKGVLMSLLQYFDVDQSKVFTHQILRNNSWQAIANIA